MSFEWELTTPSTPLARLVTEFSGYDEHMAVVHDDIEALTEALAQSDGDVNHVRFSEQIVHTPLTLAIVCIAQKWSSI